jgi:general secretion pathway protein F
MSALVAAIVFGMRSPAARAVCGRLAWGMPWWGRQLRTVALARLYRALGLLLAAGVPTLQSIEIAAEGVAPALRGDLAQARRRVGEGQRLSDALEAQGLATAVARRMLRVGEGSGSVADMLERAAAFHEEELVRLSEFVTRVLNPVLMLVMGVAIGGIIVLMYLPIFQLVEQVQ